MGNEGAFKRKSWSPYVVGAAIGVLSWFTFASVNKPIGISGAFENSAALTEKAVSPQAAAQNSYFPEKEREGKAPKINWEWMLVLGVFFGALLSASLSGDRARERVPALWAWRFGPGPMKRYAAAFFGGGLMMFGARLAQGCTSGHGISGVLQLALSSWMFVVLIFLTAIATSHLLFGKEGKQHV